ncbi:unnamed protein product, partial [Trichogramma brassicae]
LCECRRGREISASEEDPKIHLLLDKPCIIHTFLYTYITSCKGKGGYELAANKARNNYKNTLVERIEASCNANFSGQPEYLLALFLHTCDIETSCSMCDTQLLLAEISVEAGYKLSACADPRASSPRLSLPDSSDAFTIRHTQVHLKSGCPRCDPCANVSGAYPPNNSKDLPHFQACQSPPDPCKLPYYMLDVRDSDPAKRNTSNESKYAVGDGNTAGSGGGAVQCLSTTCSSCPTPINPNMLTQMGCQSMMQPPCPCDASPVCCSDVTIYMQKNKQTKSQKLILPLVLDVVRIQEQERVVEANACSALEKEGPCAVGLPWLQIFKRQRPQNPGGYFIPVSVNSERFSRIYRPFVEVQLVNVPNK